MTNEVQEATYSIAFPISDEVAAVVDRLDNSKEYSDFNFFEQTSDGYAVFRAPTERLARSSFFKFYEEVRDMRCGLCCQLSAEESDFTQMYRRGDDFRDDLRSETNTLLVHMYLASVTLAAGAFAYFKLYSTKAPSLSLLPQLSIEKSFAIDYKQKPEV